MYDSAIIPCVSYLICSIKLQVSQRHFLHVFSILFMFHFIYVYIFTCVYRCISIVCIDMYKLYTYITCVYVCINKCVYYIYNVYNNGCKTTNDRDWSDKYTNEVPWASKPTLAAVTFLITVLPFSPLSPRKYPACFSHSLLCTPSV